MSLFLLFIPAGFLVADALALEGDRGLLARLALWSGLSMALVPLALLWLTLTHITVNVALVRGAFLVTVAVALWRWLVRVDEAMRRRVGESTSQRGDGSTSQRVDGSTTDDISSLPRYLVTSLPRHLNSSPRCLVTYTVVAILFLAAVLRFMPLAGLAVPPWIDSVHHVVVTRLILDRGGVPDSYQPFLPVSPFLYHFGFHALSAALVWLSGTDPTSAVLTVGQALSFLAPLGAYWLATYLTGMCWAGAISALVVGTISLMPTYYINWGRYTHLAGMSLLPAAIVLSVDALEQRTQRRRGILAAAVILAGLALTHYRVLVFALAYLAVYLLVSILAHVHPLTRSRWTKVQREHNINGGLAMGRWSTIGAVATVALLLASPWLLRIGRAAVSQDGIWSGLAVDASYNAFPHDLLLASVGRPLALLAVWGWLLALWRREKRLVAVGLWVPVLFLVANPQIVGLRASPLITNSSVLISLYLPLALLVGYLVAVVVAEIEKRMDEPWRRRYRTVLAALIVLVALWGVRSLWPVMTPETVLADEEDLLALSWIEGNVPVEAKFLINARRWQANIYVGTDGGYWIPALTGRQTTVPPALYVQGSPEYVARINSLAEITAEGPDVDDSAFRRRLAREGVTHVYLGVRGSLLPPQAFLESTHYALAYASGNVWIFEVLSEGEG